MPNAKIDTLTNFPIILGSNGSNNTPTTNDSNMHAMSLINNPIYQQLLFGNNSMQNLQAQLVQTLSKQYENNQVSFSSLFLTLSKKLEKFTRNKSAYKTNQKTRCFEAKLEQPDLLCFSQIQDFFRVLKQACFYFRHKTIMERLLTLIKPINFSMSGSKITRISKYENIIQHQDIF